MVADSPEHPALQRNRLGFWAMLFILGAPPLAWIAQMTIAELLSTTACSSTSNATHQHDVMLLISVACLLLVIAAAWRSWHAWRDTRHEQPEKSNSHTRSSEDEVVETGEGRTRFLALTALMECGLFAIAIIITAVALTGTVACSAVSMAISAAPSGMSRGEYVAKLGDCVSCHSAPDRHDFAGGFPLHSPLGIIYGTNITPDVNYGIGAYSRDEFRKAVREGIAKGGRRLYPAMPYPSFSGMSDEDVDALYEYLMHEVAPVAAPSTPTRLHFPLNQRWAIRLWNWLFLRNQRYAARNDRDAQWNRGAYLVETVAHCGACHTPRGLAYQERGTTISDRHYLGGSDVDKWYSANLSSDHASGLGRWTQADIAQFIGTGSANGSVAFGSMRQVVSNSGRYMTQSDRQAIAYYLKSMPAHGEAVRFINDAKPEIFERPGAGLYAQACSKCHQQQGEGTAGKYPRLRGNPIVLSADPLSIVRLILEGGPHTAVATNDKHMPSFANYTDAEVAAVTTYIRGSWGNKAMPVSERTVMQIRRELRSATPG